MKVSHKEVRDSAILVGNIFNHPTELKIQLFGLFETVKNLSYQMFIINYNQYFEKDDNVFQAVNLLREYCIEMKEYGEVKFNDKNIKPVEENLK